MPTVHLIRHAQASFGTADYDVLSELGHRQVQALVAELRRRGLRPAQVVSGALRRQRDTAAPCAEAAGVELVIDTRFDEYADSDVLAHYSTTTARTERDPDDDAPAMSSREFQVLLDEALRGWVAAGDAGPSATTWPAFRDSVRAGLDDVLATLGSGETALIFTSSGVIAALSAGLMGVPGAFVELNRVTVNTGVSKIVHGRQGTTLVSFNEHTHLEDGLLTYR